MIILVLLFKKQHFFHSIFFSGFSTVVSTKYMGSVVTRVFNFLAGCTTTFFKALNLILCQFKLNNGNTNRFNISYPGQFWGKLKEGACFK